MNYKLLFSFLLISASLSASEDICYPEGTFFAPYDSPLPVSIDNHLDGIVWRRCPDNYHRLKDVLCYSFKGYVQLGNGFFFKQGLTLFGSKLDYSGFDRYGFVERCGFDLQLGKYWEGIGALRVGIFYSGPGIGGDLWLVRKRISWLTTLEIAANRVHEGYERDFRPVIKWLNRVFIYNNLYLTFGINHLGGDKLFSYNSFEPSRTQGFIGFGTSL